MYCALELLMMVHLATVLAICVGAVAANIVIGILEYFWGW